MPLSRVATLNLKRNIPRNMIAFRKKQEFCGNTQLRTTDTHFKA